jgi:hypothetical protein
MTPLRDRYLVAIWAATTCAVLAAPGVADASPSDAVALSFEGPWVLAGPSKPLTSGDGKPLPLRAAAQKTYVRNIADKKAVRNGFDPLSRCLPAGIPRLYSQPNPFRLVVGTRYVGMLFETQHIFRIVTMYRGHFEAIAPGYQGQAIGHWEGNTLVVDSDQFNDVTLLDDFGLPHSEDLHLVERITVPADGKLHIAMTITDPKTFSKPFTTQFVFEKRTGALLKEDYCLQRMGLKTKR